MSQDKKNKIRVQAYMSPYVVEKMDALIKKKNFSSRSDFVNQAVNFFIMGVEKEK